MFVERYPLDVTPESGIVPGAIKGTFVHKQPGYAEEELPDDHPEVVEFTRAIAQLLKPPAADLSAEIAAAKFTPAQAAVIEKLVALVKV